ncbi:PAP2 superfamily protein [Bradyrhizobium lablabi]|uniref:PAP2 superfamily protein n=1 Tax=Bradyrhizobium lablabi TaxID=722472 RepID=A0A1M6HUJ1_9BRAD|nr:phosphatase PAP2 family protein [Bradyrhizobium lablabi]SHJ25817.1 PAP2 superfamily protein [Bradyrhizobium lablabi]
MPAQIGSAGSQNYLSGLLALVRRSALQLVRPPSHSRRSEAARRLARHSLLITAIVGALVIVLMVGLDAQEIALMPPRGSAGLWIVRILTDFGKETYVLCLLAGMLLVVAVMAPGLRRTLQSRLLSFGTRLQFLFFAVLAPVLAGEVIKWIAGRGRPFVGGKANPFNFVPFSGTEAHASFPSAHAITSVALAFAISAVWPRARPVMIVYVLLIVATRLVLLAHHPSDVVAGGLIGVIGAMAVRYWFAARSLGFAIHRDGEIVPIPGVGRRLKRVAAEPSAP